MANAVVLGTQGRQNVYLVLTVCLTMHIIVSVILVSRQIWQLLTWIDHETNASQELPRELLPLA
jgi:hypothetical protein